MLAAVVRASRRRWSHLEELAALQAELLDQLLRLTVRVHSDPKHPPKFGEPFRYPRANAKAEQPKRGLDRAQVRRSLMQGR